MLPAVALVIALLLKLDDALAIGLMVLSCCPGGVSSNVMTKLAHGDVALSIAFTAVASIVTVFTLPLIVNLSYSIFYDDDLVADFEILGTGITMFLLTTLPVAIGMTIRHCKEPGASIKKCIDITAIVLFVLIVIAAIGTEIKTIVNNIGTLGPAVILLCAIMILVGYFVPKIFGVTARQATTVSIESSIQNATVGIAIGNLVVKPIGDMTLSSASIPSAVYGPLMYIIIAPFMIWKIKSGKPAEGEDDQKSEEQKAATSEIEI